MPTVQAHRRCNERWLELLWPSGFLTSRPGVLVVAAMVFLPLILIVSSRAIWSPTRIHGFLSGDDVCQGKDYSVQAQEAGGGSVASRNYTRRDRLLGGLLSAEFDEESCLSRYRLAAYRKSSPRSPPSYLIQSLRQYEALHKKCGPSTDLYNQRVHQLKSGNGNMNMTNECNYVIWLNECGLGNRILTLASAFLYALLTNRVLLVENNADMKDLFCEAFPGSSWILPSNFPLFPFKGYNARCPQSYGNMLRNNSINDDSVPASIYLHLAHDYNDLDKRFFCDEDQQSILRRIPWLIMRSDVYFAASLFEMPAFNDKLNLLFPEKDTVFHHLGRYLFHPTNHVWELITRYYDCYLANADTRLGIQIRVFDDSDSRSIGDLILKCTSKENLLPAIDNSGQSITHTTKNTTRSKAVLLTSLRSEYYDMLQDMYRKRPAANGEIVRLYQPSSERTQKIGNSLHEKKALAEMYLLSMTDELVTSATSTFGYVAQGLGGLKPWIMFKPENQRVPDPPCKQVDSIEPCFLAPPYYNCKAKKFDYGILGNPHLMHCEDSSSGTKLTAHIK